MSNSKAANNQFAQAIFDCRDILLPKGSGKGGQRRRSDLRNILFTIATQGEYSEVHGKSKNGLWWTQPRLETHTGIGRGQLRSHIEWLVSVGLVRRQRRMNSSTIIGLIKRFFERSRNVSTMIESLTVRKRNVYSTKTELMRTRSSPSLILTIWNWSIFHHKKSTLKHYPKH